MRPVSDNTWLEAGLTYNNAPTLGPVVNTSGSFSTGAWTGVDVTSLVSGNGVLNLAITGASSTGISLRSRESSFPPRLDLTLSGGADADADAHADACSHIDIRTYPWNFDLWPCARRLCERGKFSQQLR
ncbi:MAG: hypothetical protein IPM07_13070 [Anaerolineales bacterium]|nr:hypothetical protein [Anaerolineales bacterium]